jgi:hypothetical protein
MVQLLGGMLGPGSNQVGAATFHLQYAFRGRDDVLEAGA